MDLQDHAAILDSQLQQQLGSNYTGDWLNPKSGKVAIGITAEGYEQTASQDLDNLGLADNSEIIKESASWTDLLAAQESIDSTLKGLEEAGRVSTGVDVAHNAVYMKEANSLTTPQKAEVSAAASGVSVPTRVEEAPEATVRSETDEGQCEHSVCSEPLRGGAHIEWHPSGEPLSEKIIQCTAGFDVRSKYNALPYILTAGHCLYHTPEVGAGWNSARPTDRETDEGHTYYSYGDRFIGHGHSYMYGEHHGGPAGTSAKGDAGLIAMESGAFWTSHVAPLVTDYGVNEDYAIDGWAETPSPRQQYLVVCSSGAPYEKPLSRPALDNPNYFGGQYPVPTDRCGAVLQLHVDTESENRKGEVEARLHGLVEVEMCDTKGTTGFQHGMSGGPVFKAHFAFGIVEGSETDNPCHSYYQPIGAALEELHVNLVTG